MTVPNFKIIIGLASLLVVSVAHGKCYPGLDCPEDLPNANNTSSQQTPESMPTPESLPQAEEQPTTESMRIVGWKKAQEPDDSSEELPAPSKYKKYPKYPR